MRLPRLFPSLASALAGLTTLVVAAAAHAQQQLHPAPPIPGVPDTPPAPVITKPVVRSDAGVVYPQRALDEGVDSVVTVPLIVTVDVHGAVTKAEVTQPAGHGFDEAAVEGALKLQFDPATRDGKPVAARIGFSYTFTPPPAAFSGTVLTLPGDRPIAGATVVVRDAAGAGQTTTTDEQGAWRVGGLPAGTYHVTVTAEGRAPHEADDTLKPATEERVVDRLAHAEVAPPPEMAVDAGEAPMIEVEVHGQKPPREVVKVTLSQAELNRIPGTGGDALKSLQNLPGVARPPSILGLLIVRGSAPADSQYFIDGTPIPIVFHFGGIYAVVPTEMVDKIDFFPGNFSTQYGRAMGAIVDVGLTDPKSDRIHALAEVNAIDARAIVQGPIFDTGWNFSVAARRSYIDAWLGPVLKQLSAGASVAPVYYDYQAILERKLDPNSSLRFAFFGSDDRLSIILTSASPDNPTLAGSLGDHMGFWRGQALYKSRISDNTEVRVVAAAGEDIIDINAGSLLLDVTEWPITGRAEIAQKLGPRLTMNVGLDMIYMPYNVTVRAPPLPRPGQPPPGPLAGQQLLESHDVASVYEPAAYVEWEATPWKGARIVPGIRLDYTKEYARDTHVWDFDPRVVIRQDIMSSPRTTLKAGAGIFTQPPQPQETNAVFGMPGLTSNRAYHYDVGIEHEFTPQIEATLDGYYKQLDHLVVQGLGNTGSGVVYGAELLLRYKPDAHFFGWMSYSLSRSVRRDAPGMPLRIFQYDETHVLTAVGSYKLGRGWEFGARFRLTSGYMDTTQQYGYLDETVGVYNPLQAYPPNSTRLPLFTSLDVRIDKTWKFRWGSLGMYLDVWNVYNNSNVDGLGYNFNSTKQSPVGDLPILPSLGVHLEY
ncbi:MAG: TonB family protein [Polyangiaceae bacterium]|nr:TonB family protein [Polyangiaceae bacterium]